MADTLPRPPRDAQWIYSNIRASSSSPSTACPCPRGGTPTTVDDAVAAANEIGYPCVVKAQVAIGGRGKAGGIKVAKDEDEARAHAEAILGMDIRGLHRPRPLGRGGLGDRRRVLRLDHPRPLGEEAAGDPLADGRHGRRGDRRDRPRRARPAPHRPGSAGSATTSARGARRRRRRSTRTSPTRSPRCWSSSPTWSTLRTRR